MGALGNLPELPTDLTYIALLFALFVVPKALLRYRIPDAVTCLLLGFAAVSLGFEHGNPTVEILSTFGITALFLFAGLEIDAHELRRGARTLVQHAIIWSALVVAVSVLLIRVLGLEWRPAALASLALLTPSTGFILSSLRSLGLAPAEQFSVKTKAVGSELIALAALFFIMQTTSWQRFGIATGAMILIVAFIPFAFRLFATRISPWAPRSEFAFLLMVAVVCAYATRQLGVYYLVGAFLVGVAAQRFRTQLPAMSSERMVDALEAFGSVFIPFYFFAAGTHIAHDQITWVSAAVGLGLVLVAVPLRVLVVEGHRRVALDEAPAASRRVAVALVPTLVFTLVLSNLLTHTFGAPPWLVGALIIYTVVNTALPAFVLRASAAEYSEPVAEAAGGAGVTTPSRTPPTSEAAPPAT
ncbi:MAG TPA: cation:proton antiporter [Gemmatimonadaceae bacterium]|nr:cation:proton antiporter [Gemmatimonadaceae bacterium]